jgi:radical SAM protein (TIGR01212 family)
MMQQRFYDLNTYFREKFGCRVQKITIDAGLTCPNRDGTISSKGCIFCNDRGSGTGAHQIGLSITEQLVNGKKALSKRYKANKFIAYFQSFSNTYAPISTLESLYDEALAVEDVVGLSIGTRPDCVTSPILDLLQSYAKDRLLWIEYGLQSIHDKTLDVINRGHHFQAFSDAVQNTQGRGIQICAHVILGLPNETATDMLETARVIGELGIDGIKLHLLYVVKGTRLAALYHSGRYRCLEQSEYVDLVCRFLEMLPPGLVIQRLTGDPHLNELVAPAWALEKAKTLNLIREKLEKEDGWQGKRWSKNDT